MESFSFENHWNEKYKDIYEEKKPSAISWFFGTAGPELCDLVRKGIIKRGSKFVDLGCGIGMEALFMAVHGMEVIGVDNSQSALNIGQQLENIYGTKVKWINADVLKTTIEDEYADVVSDNFIFHNIKITERDTYAKEISRIIKKDGIFILRGFSDKMVPGSGPLRLSAEDILTTFMPYFKCEHLSRFMNFPTKDKPEQWHWFTIWIKK